RLLAVRAHLDGDDEFLANYSDGLTDLDLPTYLADFRAKRRVASFLSVRSTHTYHVVSVGDGGIVTGVRPINDSDVWINAGFFAFRREIFDYIGEGEDLVYEPFQRRIDVTWVVLSSTPVRLREAADGAHAFLDGAERKTVAIETFRERYFPFVGAEIKEYFDELGRSITPDIVFTHRAADMHQDHRLL